jgi:hypothetical protein
MSKECGECTVCCTLLEAAYLNPPKPAGQPCPHCVDRKGCSIYAERPYGCREFECLWKQTLQPPELRPDQCGVVFSAYWKEGLVAALAENEEAISEHAMKLMEAMMHDGFPVWMRVGKVIHLMLPNGMSEQTARQKYREVLERKHGGTELHYGLNRR